VTSNLYSTISFVPNWGYDRSVPPSTPILIPTWASGLTPGSPDFPRDFKSHLRNILPANPFSARICADAWQSARPNSLVSKLLQLNYQKFCTGTLCQIPALVRIIKVTGVRCGSPALRGEQFCYFHYRMLCTSRVSHVALLENEEAIQVSLMEIVNSLLRGTIDVKRGELVLRALNTAVRNIRRTRFEKAAGMVVSCPKTPSFRLAHGPFRAKNSTPTKSRSSPNTTETRRSRPRPPRKM
jgi:hypothetical protein